MSAFICRKETYSRIYSGFKVWGKFHDFYETNRQVELMLDNVRVPEDFDRVKSLVEELRRLNNLAVNQRYNEKSPLIQTPLKFDPHIDRFQWLKDLECLRYQMSEGDVPEESMYKMLDVLIGKLRYDLIQGMPEYKAAEWD